MTTSRHAATAQQVAALPLRRHGSGHCTAPVSTVCTPECRGCLLLPSQCARPCMQPALHRAGCNRCWCCNVELQCGMSMQLSGTNLLPPLRTAVHLFPSWRMCHRGSAPSPCSAMIACACTPAMPAWGDRAVPPCRAALPSTSATCRACHLPCLQDSLSPRASVPPKAPKAGASARARCAARLAAARATSALRASAHEPTMWEAVFQVELLAGSERAGCGRRRHSASVCVPIMRSVSVSW